MKPCNRTGTKPGNCPICQNVRMGKNFSNSLKNTYPGLAVQFDAATNNVSSDKGIACGKKKFNWKCSKGHEWESTISNRVYNKTGCPLCAGVQLSDENTAVCTICNTVWHNKNALSTHVALAHKDRGGLKSYREAAAMLNGEDIVCGFSGCDKIVKYYNGTDGGYRGSFCSSHKDYARMTAQKCSPETYAIWGETILDDSGVFLLDTFEEYFSKPKADKNNFQCITCEGFFQRHVSNQRIGQYLCPKCFPHGSSRGEGAGSLCGSTRC